MTLRVVALKTLFKTSPRAGEVEALASGEGYYKNTGIVTLGFERSEFAECPGWYINFCNKDIIFLDARDSSLKLTRKHDVESGGVKDDRTSSAIYLYAKRRG